jgi:two-component system chemotaxis sensor kinase CheA
MNRPPNHPSPESKFDLVIRTTRDLAEILELLEPFRSQCGFAVDEIPYPPDSLGIQGVQKIGQILVQQGSLDAAQLRNAIAGQKPFGEKLVEGGLVTPDQVEAALETQKRQKKQSAANKQIEMLSSIRVGAHKLDHLVNLIGELVTIQDQLSVVSETLRGTPDEKLAEVFRTMHLEAISEEVCRLTNDLRENALSIRMLPIKASFEKFRRLVRDLGTELGKEIDLVMEGLETEIDKTVIDRLDEPLLHIIRNCADHGLEPPEERLLKNKPRRGIIHLSAEHTGGKVIVRIRDDGKGLDRKAIIRRALESKIIRTSEGLSEKDIFALVLQPGFSTASKITNVSGRGVGMDVVKKTVDDLRGSMEISSTPDEGTTIEITLPLSLAIIDGLLVKIEQQSYIFPLDVVEECIELKDRDEGSKTDRNLIYVRESTVPYIALRDLFKSRSEKPDIEQIVLTGLQGQKVGFVVDQVFGEHKTVIKPMGKMFLHTPAFSGASILGDGSIALILNIAQLAESFQKTISSKASPSSPGSLGRGAEIPNPDERKGKFASHSP